LSNRVTSRVRCPFIYIVAHAFLADTPVLFGPGLGKKHQTSTKRLRSDICSRTVLVCCAFREIIWVPQPRTQRRLLAAYLTSVREAAGPLASPASLGRFQSLNIFSFSYPTQCAPHSRPQSAAGSLMPSLVALDTLFLPLHPFLFSVILNFQPYCAAHLPNFQASRLAENTLRPAPSATKFQQSTTPPQDKDGYTYPSRASRRNDFSSG
jgi:hypothetical protein